MSHAETIHRAWVILSIGTALMGLALLQLWAGKAFVGFGLGPSPWAFRKKEPFLFWGNIIPIGVAGLFGIGLALSALLRNSN